MIYVLIFVAIMIGLSIFVLGPGVVVFWVPILLGGLAIFLVAALVVVCVHALARGVDDDLERNRRSRDW